MEIVQTFQKYHPAEYRYFVGLRREGGTWAWKNGTVIPNDSPIAIKATNDLGHEERWDNPYQSGLRRVGGTWKWPDGSVMPVQEGISSTIKLIDRGYDDCVSLDYDELINLYCVFSKPSICEEPLPLGK